jgi:serine/threonine protein kinase
VGSWSNHLPAAPAEASPRSIGELSALPGEIIQRGSWKKARIRVVDWRDRRVVLKDWFATPRPVRPLARRLIRHEEQIYRTLAGVEGVPRLIAAGDRILALEHVPGRPISRFRGEASAPDLVRRLVAVVEKMHAAGVYHADLRKRDNILVTEDGRLGIVDFDSAVRVSHLGPPGRLLIPILALVDRYAVLKWKRWLCPADLTASETQFLRRLDTLRLRRWES